MDIKSLETPTQLSPASSIDIDPLQFLDYILNENNNVEKENDQYSTQNEKRDENRPIDSTSKCKKPHEKRIEDVENINKNKKKSSVVNLTKRISKFVILEDEEIEEMEKSRKKQVKKEKIKKMYQQMFLEIDFFFTKIKDPTNCRRFM